MTYNLLTCAEMVVIALAQSQAFNWTQFQIDGAVSKKAALRRDNCCVTFFKILFASTDVFDDAHKTFLREELADPREKETQMDEINKSFAAASWSDDENAESEKYRKKKRPSSREKQSIKTEPPCSKLETTRPARDLRSYDEEFSTSYVEIEIAQNHSKDHISVTEVSQGGDLEQMPNQ